MKKTYINPTTEIVNVEMAQMIAASGDFNRMLDTNGASGSSALSNDEFDIWSLIETGR